MRRRLAAAVRALAVRLGTPPFEPHVTLVGRVVLPPADARARLRQLGRQIEPFRVRLGKARWGRQYFHCVFLEAPRSCRLAAARARAMRVFGARAATRYRPHLSLVYGDLAVRDRRRLAREIGSTLGATLQVRAVELVLTEGDVTEWRRLARVRLGRP